MQPRPRATWRPQIPRWAFDSADATLKFWSCSIFFAVLICVGLRCFFVPRAVQVQGSHECFEAFIEGLEEDVKVLLMELCRGGKILNGSPKFFVLNDERTFKEVDEGGSMNNGMFSCHLQETDYQEPVYTKRVFIACIKAQIVLVLEGDATDESPTGEMMRIALEERGAAYLGDTGSNRATGMRKLDQTFTDKWRCGSPSLRGNLQGETYTINSIQVLNSDIKYV